MGEAARATSGSSASRRSSGADDGIVGGNEVSGEMSGAFVIGMEGRQAGRQVVGGQGSAEQVWSGARGKVTAGGVVSATSKQTIDHVRKNSLADLVVRAQSACNGDVGSDIGERVFEASDGRESGETSHTRRKPWRRRAPSPVWLRFSL